MARAITRRGQQSRQRIVDAACTLFHRGGVSATSVDDILNHVDMGKSQFYHYFQTKEELVCEVVTRQMDAVLKFLEPSTARLNRFEDLDQWFAACADLARLHQYLGCPVGTVAAETPPESLAVRSRVVDALNRWTAALTGALSRLQQNGQLNECFEPERSAEFIGATVQGALLVGRAYGSSRPFANATRQLKRYLESYLPT